ncbi:MAG: beta-eliminating lyase-related protein [Actinomycetota bacterium]|nr:beta-eliminating lyase-related protein [Actinomycetota bacterium]
MPRRRVSYFDRYSASDATRLDELVALQRGVIGSRIHLIASACYPFDAVLRALAEPSFVLPAEGMPGARYLPGAEVMDLVEEAGEDLTLELFGRPPGYRATLQPHSGTQANQIVYNAVLQPDDAVLCLRPRDGGHISHTVLISRRHPTINYGLAADGAVDYDQMRALALAHRPRLIIVGGSALPRAVDFKVCAGIAAEVGALLHADVSHTATFVAAKLHPSTFPHCDFVTFNSVKNLRGPNSGLLVYRSEFASAVAGSIFPTTQGGANESGMLGKLACLLEWHQRDIRAYASAIVTCARTLGNELTTRGIRLVTGGTDSHLLLLDLRGLKYSGADLERRLECRGVLANRNLVPADPRSPTETSGLRLGATNLAILGYKPNDLSLLADWLTRALSDEPPSAGTVEHLVQKYQRHLVAPVW